MEKAAGQSDEVSCGALQTLGFLSCHTKLSMHGLKRTFWIGGRAKKMFFFLKKGAKDHFCFHQCGDDQCKSWPDPF